MKNIIHNLLLMIPWFVMVRQDKDEPPEMKFNASDFIRTLVVSFLVAIASSLVTVRVIQNDVSHIVTSATKMEAKVDILCNEINIISKELAIVKVRQDERLDREAREWKRKK